MLTWLVHMRSPLRLMRELGPTGFLVFQLMIGGMVVAASIHPLLLAWLIYELLTGMHSTAIGGIGLASPHVLFLLFGYLVSALIGVAGLKRRRSLRCAWALLLIPVYWMMLSIAVWRALAQLIRDPYRWEKTEHGLTRMSRLVGR